MDVPTVLVLGNEGHGIRTNVLRRCTHLVRINGKARDSPVEVDEESASLVDSLNVSVTGGVILHHFLSRN